MAKKTSIINVVVAGDSKPLRNALGKATKSLGTMTKQIGKFSLAAGAAFAAVGAKSIGLAVDFEESLSKANQIFGDAAKGIETSAKGAATAVGLSQAEFLEAASSFGVFGKAAGLTGDDLSTFSTDLVTLSADVASFNNLKPEDALAKLNAGLRGSVEPLQSIGVLMTAAAVEAEGLNMGLIEQGEKLSEGQKIMARHSLIMQQLGAQGATGDFARTSEGLANTQRILNARLKNLGITLGRVLLPIAEKMAAALGALITKFEEWTPALKNAANAVVDFLTPVKETVQRWLPILANWLKETITEKVIPALITAFDDLRSAFTKTKKHIIEHKELYISLAIGIGAAIAAFKLLKTVMVVTTAMKAFSGAIGIALAPATLLAAAIVAVVGGISYLMIVSPKARAVMGAIWDVFLEKVEEVKTAVQFVIDLVKTLIDVSGNVKDFFTGDSKTSEAAKGAVSASPLGQIWRGATQGVGLVSGLFNRADGGIIMNKGLAMVAENGPEAIVPLSKMGGMGGMGTTTININMPAGADGNDIVAALEAYVRRNGSIPLATNSLVRK